MPDGNTPVLPDHMMRHIGFTDHREGYWFYSRGLGHGVAFTVTIQKNTGDYTELVEDLDFGQPAYYGRWREPYRTTIHQGVKEQLAILFDRGLRVEVDESLYHYASPCTHPSGHVSGGDYCTLCRTSIARKDTP